MSMLDRIAQGMLRPINPYSTLILGVFTAFWGIWVLMPWSVFGRADLFSKLSEFAPEVLWGLWATGAGILVIASIIRGLYRYLAWTLAFIGWHWATVAVFMWWGDWQNTGGLTYSFAAVYASYAYLNVKINQVNNGEEMPHFLD